MNASPLQYLDSAPRDSDPSTAAPLLVTFHGFGSHMGDLHELRQVLDARFHVCSPQAPIDLAHMGMPGGWAWFNLEFKPDEGIGYDNESAHQAIELAETFVLEQQKRLGTKDVVLLGFSQGAMLVHALLLRGHVHPAGIAACSGRMVDEVFGAPDEAEGLDGMPMFISHGRFDDVIPIESGRAIKEWYTHTGAILDYNEYDMAHGIDPACMSDLTSWCTQLLDQTSTR